MKTCTASHAGFHDCGNHSISAMRDSRMSASVRLPGGAPPYAQFFVGEAKATKRQTMQHMAPKKEDQPAVAVLKSLYEKRGSWLLS